jgi:hypothetical protein
MATADHDRVDVARDVVLGARVYSRGSDVGGLQ